MHILRLLRDSTLVGCVATVVKRLTKLIDLEIDIESESLDVIRLREDREVLLL